MQALLIHHQPIRRDHLIVVKSFEQGDLELSVDGIGEDLLVVGDEVLKAGCAG